MWVGRISKFCSEKLSILTANTHTQSVSPRKCRRCATPCPPWSVFWQRMGRTVPRRPLGAVGAWGSEQPLWRSGCWESQNTYASRLSFLFIDFIWFSLWLMTGTVVISRHSSRGFTRFLLLQVLPELAIVLVLSILETSCGHVLLETHATCLKKSWWYDIQTDKNRRVTCDLGVGSTYARCPTSAAQFFRPALSSSASTQIFFRQQCE